MSRTMTVAIAAGAVALAGTLAGASTVAANAADSGADRTTATTTRGLISPLSLAVAGNGTRYFSQSFAGILMRQVPGKPARTIYVHPNGAEVGGVSVRDGRVLFTSTKGSATFLLQWTGKGTARRVADLGSYEKKANPDKKVRYGFRDLAPGCLSQFPANGVPPQYTGIVESHPYATTQAADGTTYIADAAANAVLAVGPGGNVRKVAVLPPVPLTITTEFAAQNQVPNCAVGHRYYFEGVPTDVELGPNGQLYVSSLPGGPEDGSLGKAGAIYKVNPRTGAVTKRIGGLTSPTGVAVSPTGAIFAAELFGFRISRVAPGGSVARTFQQVAFPGDVEWSPRGVFATTNVLSGLSGQPGDVPDGTLQRYALPGH